MISPCSVWVLRLYPYKDRAVYQNDAEVLFPTRVIISLCHLRGEAWQQLVEHVADLPDGDLDSLAFSLMMIRLGNCLPCLAASYRTLHGCTACAHQALIRMWEVARAEVITWLQTGIPPLIE